MVLKKIFNYIYKHKFITFLVICFCCFILFSFNNKSSAHSEYYDTIQTFTNGKPWVLYNLSGISSDRLFIAVSPDTRKARTINNYGFANGLSYGLVGFTEVYDTDYWIKNNVYELKFTNGEFNGTFNGPNYDYAWNTILGRYSKIVDINYSTYDYNNNIVYNVSTFEFVDPYITTSSSTIENWSFDNLDINGGDVSPYWQNINQTPIYYQNYRFYLEVTTNGLTYSTDIYKYVTIDDDNKKFTISIPRYALSNSFNLYDNQTISFYLRMKAIINSTGEVYEDDGFDLGTYTVVLTAQEITDINNDSDKFVQSSIEQNQQETNEKLDDLNNNINNSNIDDSNVEDFGNLGNSFNANDVSGIDQLFQVLYNAFCTDEIQALVFTIPFTNKQVTINTTNISSYFPQQIKSIVGIFVWGIIGLWVLKDIRTTINKISEGSPENVGSDVKKEVL